MCGISKTYPFCDGSHSKTKDETNELCCYDKDGNRLTSISLDDQEITDV